MMKILFVDDDAIARKTASVKINWGDLGYHFLTPADNGLDALDVIRKELPDIIICDIKMPGMDGIQMAEIAKNYSPDLEFIFLSGYQEFEYAKQALQLNAVDYLTKPFDATQLITVIKKAEERINLKRKEQSITCEKYPLIQRKYLSQLLASNFSHADDEVFKAFDFNITDGCGMVIFAELKSNSTEPKLLRSLTEDICNFLTQRHNGCFFIPMENQEIFIIYTHENIDCDDIFLDYIEDLKNEIRHFKNNTIFSALFYSGTIMYNLNDLYDSYQNALSKKNSDTYQILSNIKLYIEEQYFNPALSLGHIAYKFNISKCYLTRLFKERYGVNLYDYVINVRMEKASELLHNTSLKSYEIAEKVGYTNSAYFSISFKKHYGCTVSEYKNQIKIR